MKDTDPVPKDIWDLTNMLVPGNVTPYTPDQREAYRALVAVALMQERERCAQVAENFGDGLGIAGYTLMGMRREIAFAIRSTPPHTGKE